MSEAQEQDKDSKTEEPSSKKLEDALEKGQVVNSREVTSFVAILLLTMSAFWFIPASLTSISQILYKLIANSGNIRLEPGTTYAVLSDVFAKILLYLSPIFLITCLAAIISSYIQHGQFIFTFEQVQPKLSKISIVSGFNRLVSIKSLVEFLKGVFKISLVGTLVVLVILADVKELGQYQELSIGGILAQLSTMVNDILVLVTIIMAVIAAVDYAYQSYEHYTQLKMTKQEVKDEYKQTEGNPEVKQKLSALRKQQAQRRINNTVPQATVVITNPEHFAVALQYDANSPMAPICVAKGQDLIAQKIKEIAKEHQVPIVESPPLARGLYKDVEINAEIPERYFAQVAQVITYVMNLDKKAAK